MLADRIDDGRTGTGLWPVGTQPGEWRLVPPTNLNVFSWVGDIRPFSLMRTNQFKADAPPKLTSKQYARSSTRSRRSARRRVRPGPRTRTRSRTGSSSTRSPSRTDLPGPLDEPRPLDRPAGPAVRADDYLVGRRLDRLLQPEGRLPLLAAADRHPGGDHRRQPEYGRRSGLGLAVPDPGLSDMPVRLQQLHGREHGRRPRPSSGPTTSRST